MLFSLLKVSHNVRRGFKGVLMVDTALSAQQTVDAQMRKSQLKYKESTTAAASSKAVFMAVEWSKPYKYGYLNLQVSLRVRSSTYNDPSVSFLQNCHR